MLFRRSGSILTINSPTNVDEDSTTENMQPYTSVKRSNSGVNARVAHAYYKYGRFCASHPIVTILCSILSVLFLSYPLTRLRLPSSTPFDTVLADNVSEFLESDERDPSWLQGDAEPAAFIQQIFIRSKVDPWDPFDMTVKDAIKGPMIRAFELNELLTNFMTKDNLGLDNFCFHIKKSDPNLRVKYLPDRRGCLILSPAWFWQNNRAKFYDDDFIFDTIYSSPPCNNELCVRDLLFGMPTRMTGVRSQYHSNRQRRVQFAVTVVLTKYDKLFVDEIRMKVSQSYEGVNATVDESTNLASSSQKTRSEKFVHIYYKSQKTWLDYIPLYLSYIFVFVYLYFSLRKIELVKSKWGLAFSAIFTVASSLVMATGICIHFDLTPRLWSAELFPYLAMIVGIENMLCITRSVVSTPVTLDFRLRIAHGLSKEGWSITKNFLSELAVVSVGFVTRIPEIQEFCTLAFIGLVVDFYMQLFFYAPCLTFDLYRIDAYDKRHLSQMQPARHHTTIDLQVYPPVHCPFAKFFSFFRPSDGSNNRNRAKSMSSLEGPYLSIDDDDGRVGVESSSKHNTDERQHSVVRKHRRTGSHSSSNVKLTLDSNVVVRTSGDGDENDLSPRQIPRRLKFLLFLSKTRFLQRCVAVLVVGWICWLALIVHQWHNVSTLTNVFGGGVVTTKIDYNNQATTEPQSVAAVPADSKTTTPLKETSWIQWDLWQRQAFSWYPILFHHYNVSLSGRFITLLPPIILESNITPDQAKSIRAGTAPAEPKDADKFGKIFSSDLRIRISWLELQMFIVLVLSCGIFFTVAGFILYVCFISGNESYISSATETTIEPKKTHRRAGSKALVDAKPIVFRGHDHDVEFLCCTNEFLVSSCLGGRVVVWNSKTGDLLRIAKRNRVANVQPTLRRNTNSVANGSDSDLNASVEAIGVRHRTMPMNTDQLIIRPTSNGYDFGGVLPTRPNGDASRIGNMLLDFDSPSNYCRPLIWCVTAGGDFIAVGLANGAMELYNVSTGLLLCQWVNNRVPIGVTQICLRGSRVVMARLNGQMDFLELRFIQRNAQQNVAVGSSSPDNGIQCVPLNLLRGHQHPINCMKTTTRYVVTASDDHTLKVFDLHTCRCVNILYGHNAPVKEFMIDHDVQQVFSTCLDGLICIWDLEEGTMLKTLAEVSYSNGPPVALALTSTMIVGHTHDGSIWMWKKSGDLVTRIKPDFGYDTSPHVNTSTLVVLSDKLAVSAYLNAIRFWDLQYKVMLRELKLEDDSSHIKSFIKLDDLSVACCKGNYVYRVNFPMIKVS